jgi:hypothetical protein
MPSSGLAHHLNGRRSESGPRLATALVLVSRSPLRLSSYRRGTIQPRTHPPRANNGRPGITTKVFATILTGDQEVPPSGSTAIGLGVVAWDTASDTARYGILAKGVDFGEAAGVGAQTGFAGDDVTNMHVHNQARGVNGAVVFGQIGPAQDADDLRVKTTCGSRRPAGQGERRRLLDDRRRLGADRSRRRLDRELRRRAGRGRTRCGGAALLQHPHAAGSWDRMSGRGCSQSSANLDRAANAAACPAPYRAQSRVSSQKCDLRKPFRISRCGLASTRQRHPLGPVCVLCNFLCEARRTEGTKNGIRSPSRRSRGGNPMKAMA